MEFKGTNGKWEISLHDKNVGLINGNHRFTAIPYGNNIQEEDIYNAKLISKSPELLEMVKKLRNLLEEHQPNWYLLGHHREIEGLIKEATEI